MVILNRNLISTIKSRASENFHNEFAAVGSSIWPVDFEKMLGLASIHTHSGACSLLRKSHSPNSHEPYTKFGKVNFLFISVEHNWNILLRQWTPPVAAVATTTTNSFCTCATDQMEFFFKTYLEKFAHTYTQSIHFKVFDIISYSIKPAAKMC